MEFILKFQIKSINIYSYSPQTHHSSALETWRAVPQPAGPGPAAPHPDGPGGALDGGRPQEDRQQAAEGDPRAGG